MIKKLIDWITGKSDKPAEAPYKVEAPVAPASTKATIATTEQRYVGENEQGAIYETVVVAQEAVVPESTIIPVSAADVPLISPAAVEVAPVTVKAKYKRADLNKMTKAQLMELVTKHGLEVKVRSTKEELVKVLVKV